MRVLFVSALFQTPQLPEQSPPNARIVARLREHAEIEVISPVPWYPPLGAVSATVRKLRSVPRRETGFDGFPVEHPRYLHIPLIGRSLYATLYAASVGLPVRRKIAAFDPHVLMSAWAYPDGVATVMLGRLFHRPTVIRLMGSDINRYAASGAGRLQIGAGLRRATRLIAVSSEMADKVHDLGVPRDRIDQIPTGVDTGRFAPIPMSEARRVLDLPEGPVFLMVGRHSFEKGTDIFLDAFAALPERCRAVLVGTGRDGPSLEAQCARLGVADRVCFAGQQSEERLPLYYSAADLLCLPSREEGWPNVLMEALACGCPVVANGVGGVPDLVALTGSGLVVDPVSGVDGFRAAMSQALSRVAAGDWDRGETAGKMQAHSLDRTAERYAEALRRASAEAT